MIWHSWSAFFAMGGYAFYVWTAYGFATLVLLLNVLVPIWRGRAVVRMLRELSTTEQSNETET